MTCRIGYTGPNQHLAEHNILFEKRDKEADQLIHNMAVLAHHLLWNQQNGIHVLQLPLIFPRAQMGYDQSILDSDEAEWCVEQIGAFCRKYDQRVAFDLSSLTTGPEYRQRKMQQISFLGELSNRCGVAMDLVVSVGSPFANKSESMDRFKEAYSELPPHTQSLISLTNDPVVYGYTVEELGPLLRWGGIPLTLNLL